MWFYQGAIMKAYLIKQIGPIIIVIIAVGSMVWLGSQKMDLEAENRRLRAGLVSTATVTTPCLILKLPAFRGMTMEGVELDEGRCSKGSKAPMCHICGMDLSKAGRVKLLARMYELREKEKIK